jgi:hypothetical protein
MYVKSIRPALRSGTWVALIAASVALIGYGPTASAQQVKQAAPKGDPKTGKAAVPPVPKLALTDGSWSGNANFDDTSLPEDDWRRVLSFTVKNNLITGDGHVPFHFSCKLSPAAMSSEMKKSMERSSPGSNVTLVLPGNPADSVGTTSVTASLSRDFTKTVHSLSGNRFEGVFAAEDSDGKYSVTVKGTFSTGTAASGSITVTSAACKNPTVYTWEASPQPPKAP